MPSLQVYGIRHHGPGSARSLLQALEQQSPDCLLVECPSDCQALLPLIGNKGLKPPVAMLVYNLADMEQAVFLPFAEFSPEWQAIRYALRRGIPVECIDLPYSLGFGLERAATDRYLPRLKGIEREIASDPLGYLARLSGYASGEVWWDQTFERLSGAADIFENIADLMYELRLSAPAASDALNELREAYMRLRIRQAQSMGASNIAVVCGAWHTPALQKVDSIKAAEDKKRLSGLKSIKTAATWVPWSNERLATYSGYAAGIVSPAWYALLFKRPGAFAAHWLAEAARLLRRKKLDVSSAHVLEAARLADMLAVLRDQHLPGLEELEEAALSCLCEGKTERLQIIHQALVIGDLSGKVPPQANTLPLQTDFEKQVRSARLGKYYESSVRQLKELDLRIESNQVASRLLHRLLLLDIPWGKLQQPRQTQLGGFKEGWSLKWKAEYIIRLIQLSMYGATLEEAATAYMIREIAEINSPDRLALLLDQLLAAEIPAAIEPLLRRLDDCAAQSEDAFLLCRSLGTLIRILKYGSSRQVDEALLQRLIDHLVPRACLLLPIQAGQVAEEDQRDQAITLEQTQLAIQRLQSDAYNAYWAEALQRLIEIPQGNPYLQGKAARLLSESGQLSMEALALQLELVFSQVDRVQAAASWLEGLLVQSGARILLHRALWTAIRSWVELLDASSFQLILPVLRRTFSEFEPALRQRILRKVLQAQEQEEGALQNDTPQSLIDTLKSAWSAWL